MRYGVQTPENVNYTDYGEKMLQEIFSIVHDVPSDMNLIGWLRVTQSDVYSHMVVELSAVDSFMYISHRCNSIINQTLSIRFNMYAG